ncbi:hypothetical protein TNIN_322221 [Trichonephila inaurata madagascariensis]|uniref:Uncharacterized protein n=1 Tax=Trichonephila inaurata madagascariensis TaxID=2747483 RepID=A0A8X6Y751_9ARAC|nr:hypothetical protein TNIN_322221 [Trichonephila inaurata madagascariensis]
MYQNQYSQNASVPNVSLKSQYFQLQMTILSCSGNVPIIEELKVFFWSIPTLTINDYCRITPYNVGKLRRTFAFHLSSPWQIIICWTPALSNSIAL